MFVLIYVWIVQLAPSIESVPGSNRSCVCVCVSSVELPVSDPWGDSVLPLSKGSASWPKAPEPVDW